jgi:hypothetical protein
MMAREKKECIFQCKHEYYLEYEARNETKIP